MQIRRYRLNANISASANVVDTFTAQRSGTLRAVIFNILFDNITDNGTAKIMLSRAAIQDFAATGGAQTQTVAAVFQQSNFVTSGLAQPVGNFVIACNDRVSTGEALYVNALIGGTVAINCDIILVMEEA